MKLKQIFVALFLGVIALSTTACERVPVGNVGIKVYKLGGAKGVDQETLTPGRYWIGWNEELFIFPTYAQNRVWTRENSKDSPGDESITFQTVEGLSVNGDFGMQYSLQPDKIPHLFQKYRRGVDEITTVFLRNEVRNAIVSIASAEPVESIYGNGKSAFMEEVNKRVRDRVKEDGILIDTIYVIGDFRLPQTVIDALNAKIGATQKAQQRQNEVAQAKAEADKKIEEARGIAESSKLQANANAANILTEAKAQADANLLLSKSITPELIQFQAVEKWNGTLPSVTGGAVPMIQVPGTK